MWKAWPVLAAVAGALACSGVTETGRPLRISLRADRATAAPGELVAFRVDADGRFLLGVILDYGDGAVDSVAAFGASRLGVTRRHAYREAGSFRVRARAEEESGAFVAESLVVRIAAPGLAGERPAWVP